MLIEPQRPEIDITTLDQKEIRKNLGEPLRLQCKFSGIPVPVVTWYKDGLLFQADVNDTRISFNEKDTMVDIKFIKMEDEGKYRCEATNRLASAYEETTLKITSMRCNREFNNRINC